MIQRITDIEQCRMTDVRDGDCVYFIATGRLVKISSTRNLRSRLYGHLSYAGEFDLLRVVWKDGDGLWSASGVERFASRKLVAYWERGKWFRDSPELREEIQALMIPPAVRLNGEDY